MHISVHHSEEDASINVKLVKDGHIYETRFVQRNRDKIIIYFSPMSGCDLACRMCHLTQTKQTNMRPATIDDIKEQFSEIMKVIPTEKFVNAVRINFNFMARGDFFSNPILRSQINEIAEWLSEQATLLGLTYAVKISTIFPKIADDETSSVDMYKEILQSIDEQYDVDLYYSLYSLDKTFRKRWLPNALFPDCVKNILNNYSMNVWVHHALIAGENDRDEDARQVANWISQVKCVGYVNLVHYNGFDPERHGHASDMQTVRTYAHILNDRTCLLRTRIIPRVGFDVAASCGMFLNSVTGEN